MLKTHKPPFRSWTPAPLLALIVLAVTAAPALAARGHEFTTTFGEPCLAEPCTGAAIKHPAGVAVNETTGDVYVVDEGAGRVVRFSSAGTFASEFNGSGLLEGEGAAAGGLGQPGEIATGRFLFPTEIAVDNTCALEHLAEPKCKETDPLAGDVYVVDPGNLNEGPVHSVVDRYTAAGEYVGQVTEGLGVPFAGHVHIAGVAVLPGGELLVNVEGSDVYRYKPEDPAASVEPLIEVESQSQAPPRDVSGLAVDTAGHLYYRRGSELLATRTITEGRIGRASLTGELQPGGQVQIDAPETEELDSEESTGVAVDASSNDVVVDNGTTAAVFNVTGELVERLGDEAGVPRLVEGQGVAVNSTEGRVYVADAGAGAVVEFGPEGSNPPRVESEAISGVDATEATLEANINPRSESNVGATSYWFEYGRCSDPSDCAASGYETRIPVPDAQLTADFEVHAATARALGLSPAATYHFRAAASNKQGDAPAGPERVFATQGTGGQAKLADNRGWELVSPPNKLGALIEPIEMYGIAQASASGNAITYVADAPTEANPAGYSNRLQILSRRGGTSWSSRDIALPHTSATGLGVDAGAEYKAFDPELTTSTVQPFGEFIPQLSREANESTAYMHSLQEGCTSNCFKPLVTGMPGFANVPESTVFGEESKCQPKNPESPPARVVCGPIFEGATEDLTHVILSAGAELVAGAGQGQQYEWTAGKLSWVSELPNKHQPVSAAYGGPEFGNPRAISSDGSLVDWTGDEIAGQPNLYLRDVPREETIQLDEAEPGSGGNSGGGEFQFASSDGTRVFFTDDNQLTPDSGAEPRQKDKDLYECRIALSPALHCELRDLTPALGTAHEPALVKKAILGASSDGSYVYFAAEGVLSEEANPAGQRAQSGKPNLYVSHEGHTTFILTLSEGDNHDWTTDAAGVLSEQPTRVTPDGRYLAFMSQASLTGYDNRDRSTRAPVAEVYLYDATRQKLVCVSCLPSGERPIGVEQSKLQPPVGITGGPPDLWAEQQLVAANVPGWSEFNTNNPNPYPVAMRQPRYLDESGRMFFNSDDGLVAEDSNSTEDVYEYEPPGVGGCTETAEAYEPSSGGCVSLMSSGTSGQESAFLDASESGNDVYFLTSARLSKLDTDNSRDVYDAHLCSSESPCITYPTAQSPPCTTEASCKPAPSPQPSIFGAPSSATFQGPGNLVPAAPKVVVKSLTRAQKLSSALKACKKDKKKAKRTSCEKTARKKFGPIKVKRRAKKTKNAQ
jgi:DNA-binding beta-propeller fold protein YncE